MNATVRSARRNVRNVVNKYSDLQVKVREATSNDPWGPCTALMAQIAEGTHNIVAFTDIMQIIWRRLSDHGRNWRHVLKALTLLDYLVKTGNGRVAQQCRENVFAIDTLRDFQYFEDGTDHGRGVRDRAVRLVALLKDDEKLAVERERAIRTREKFAQVETAQRRPSRQANSSPVETTIFVDKLEGSGSGGSGGGGNSPESPIPAGTPRATANLLQTATPQTADEELFQLQLALAMSKNDCTSPQQQQQTGTPLSHKNTSNLDELLSLELPSPSCQLVGNSPNEKFPSDDQLVSVGAVAAEASLNSLVDPWAPNNGSQSVIDPWCPVIDPSVDTQTSSAAITPATACAVAVTRHAPYICDPWTTGASAATQLQPSGEFDKLSIGADESSKDSITAVDGGGVIFADGAVLAPACRSGSALIVDLLTTGQQDISGADDTPSGGARRPEDFLGEQNSRLVNLDNLIGAPYSRSANQHSAVNPFYAGGGGGASWSACFSGGNPFTERQQSSMSVNEIRARQVEKTRHQEMSVQPKLTTTGHYCRQIDTDVSTNRRLENPFLL